MKAADGFARNCHAFKLGQFFSRKRWPEARIFATQKRLDLQTDARLQTLWRYPPALARNQPRIPTGPIGPNQPLHLPQAQAETLGANPLRYHALHNLPDDKGPLALNRTHPQYPVRHLRPFQSKPERGHAHFAERGTFSLCANREPGYLDGAQLAELNAASRMGAQEQPLRLEDRKIELEVEMPPLPVASATLHFPASADA